MSIFNKTTGKRNYPSHLVSNEEKNRSWILQYLKPWQEYQGVNAGFLPCSLKHTEQKNMRWVISHRKYKPVLGVTEDTNESWLNIDWSVLLSSLFRRIAIKIGEETITSQQLL